jgi:hypothetical protein
MVLEVQSPYLVYSVRWSSPLQGEGLVRHMPESFRNRDSKATHLDTHSALGPFLFLRFTGIRALRTPDHLDVSAALFYICSFTITSFLDLARFSPSLLLRLLPFFGSAPKMPRVVHRSFVLSVVLRRLRRLFYLLT